MQRVSKINAAGLKTMRGVDPAMATFFESDAITFF